MFICFINDEETCHLHLFAPSAEDLIQRTFGCETRGKRPGFLRTFARKAGQTDNLRRQMGVLVLPAAWLESFCVDAMWHFDIVHCRNFCLAIAWNTQEFVTKEEESNILAESLLYQRVHLRTD